MKKKEVLLAVLALVGYAYVAYAQKFRLNR